MWEFWKYDNFKKMGLFLKYDDFCSYIGQFWKFDSFGSVSNFTNLIIPGIWRF